MIPRLIHNIWIQGYDQLPEKYKRNQLEIKKINPDWDFIIWDNQKILELLQKYPKLLSLYKNASQLSGIISAEATQSYIARYIILKDFGGLYYDFDYECSCSLNELFDERSHDSNLSIYIANSKNETIDYLWPFYKKSNYCSCFMAFPKFHPIWDKVIQILEKATNKYEIGHALDRILQINEDNYPIIVLQLCTFKTAAMWPLMSSKDNSYHALEMCEGVTRVESSWNPFRPFIQFFNCNIKKIMLFIMIFLIIFIVERMNRYNSMIFGLPSFIPGLPSSLPPNNQTTITNREKIQVHTNKTKKRSK
jgi:hypothetical protein